MPSPFAVIPVIWMLMLSFGLAWSGVEDGIDALTIIGSLIFGLSLGYVLGWHRVRPTSG